MWVVYAYADVPLRNYSFTLASHLADVTRGSLYTWNVNLMLQQRR